MSLSDNPAQFLTAVKTVALKAETPFEAMHLVDWFLANVPYVESGDDDFILFRSLDDLCHMWHENGLAEDEIKPALSLAYTFAAHGHITQAELDLLIERQARCNYMIMNPDVDANYTSYEEFCDKYAAELNH